MSPVPAAATAIDVTEPGATGLPDVLCVGLVCVDLLLAVPHHPAPDEKLRATSRLIAPGGPAAVAAAQIARLGGRAAFAGLIGDQGTDPFAPLLRNAFAAAGIDHSALRSLAGFETPLAAILVKPDASRAVLSHRPEPPAPTSPSPFTVPADTPPFPAARVLLTDGHRPGWNAALHRHARATGAPLVLDAGSLSPSVRELAALADPVVASEACARAALDGADPAAPEADLPRALGAGADAVVVATLGPRGAVWWRDGRRGRCPAFRIEAVDTTGAGDAFHGAYALGLARGMAFDDLLRFASAAGALACTRPGAWPALPDATELAALL